MGKTWLLVLAFRLLGSPSAHAQCKADTECKGGRVCRNGECVAPSPAACGRDTDCAGDWVCSRGACVAPGAQPVPSVIVTPSQQQPLDQLRANPRRSGAGWSMAAGILGIVTAAVVLGMGAASEATVTHDDVPGLPLGFSALVLSTIMGPIVAAGGSSARRAPGVDGIVALRIVGWVCYGLSWVSGIAAIVLAAQPYDGIPHGPMIVTGALSALSLTFFSIDALAGRSEALSLAPERAPRPERGGGFAIAPSLTPVRLANGSYSGTFGLAGAF